MLRDIINHIVEHHLGRVLATGREIEGDIGDGVALQFHIGLDTATVAHLTTITGIEDLRQGVRDMFTIASTTLLVVDRLDTASTGDLVFRGGHLHVRIIRQIDRNLHQALSERART